MNSQFLFDIIKVADPLTTGSNQSAHFMRREPVYFYRSGTITKIKHNKSMVFMIRMPEPPGFRIYRHRLLPGKKTRCVNIMRGAVYNNANVSDTRLERAYPAGRNKHYLTENPFLYKLF